MAERILIVDDEVDMLELLKRIIEDKTNYQVVTTPDPLEVPHILEENALRSDDHRFTDGGHSGMELLETVRQKDDQIPVIILTAYGTIETAVEAMQKGAFSYITKPFKKEEILIAIDKAFDFQRLKNENQSTPKRIGRQSSVSLFNRRQAGYGKGLSTDHAGGQDFGDDLDYRRIGDREGVGGQDPSLSQPAERQKFCGRQLFGHPGNPD